MQGLGGRLLGCIPVDLSEEGELIYRSPFTIIDLFNTCGSGVAIHVNLFPILVSRYLVEG